MAATGAFSGYSTTLQGGDASSPTEWLAISEVVRFTGIGLQRDTFEATNLTSPEGWKEFAYAMKTINSFGCEVNFLPTNTSQKALITDTTDTDALGFRTWRLVLPDYGAVTKTYTSSGTTFTSTSHGFETGQSITFTTTGTLPSGVSLGRVYWIKRATANAFQLHASPEEAYAASGAINGGTGGSGTHTANGTSLWTFTAACTEFRVGDIDPNGRLNATLQFTARGALTTTP